MIKTLERTNQFKKDFKRIKKQRPRDLDARLTKVLQALIEDQPLDPSFRDHALVGNWSSARECHLRPDLLLIYKTTEDAVILVRMGSHSDLFD